jgi:hypothetical protein
MTVFGYNNKVDKVKNEKIVKNKKKCMDVDVMVYILFSKINLATLQFSRIGSYDLERCVQGWVWVAR